MTHLTRANVPSHDDDMSVLAVLWAWRDRPVLEAVELMLGYGSNKSLNIKCAKWMISWKHLQELQKWMQKSIAP